jgi:multisubunit Na+/H+ antiporter MnhF subunit
MPSGFARLDLETYMRGLTAMSIMIVIFAGWLVAMMVVRMVETRCWTGRDVAALTYVASTLLVFLAIALRYLFEWPREVYFVIVFLKMVSVVAVTLWARRGMADGVEE